MSKAVKKIILAAVIFALSVAWSGSAMAFQFHYGGKSYDGEYELSLEFPEAEREEVYLISKDGQKQLVYAGTRQPGLTAFSKHTGNVRKIIHWGWDSRRFLFFVRAGTKDDLWMGEILADGSLQVRKVAEQVAVATFSPDGTQIIMERPLACGRPGSYLLNLASGEERLLSTRVALGYFDRYYAPQWTADGRYIFSIKYITTKFDPQQSPEFNHPFWVIDLEEGNEYQLKWVGTLETGKFLPHPVTGIFPSARGHLLVYGSMGLNEIPGHMWGLSIDLKAKTITGARNLKDVECDSQFTRWIKPGELVATCAGVMDLTGDEVKVITGAELSLLGIEPAAVPGPCPVTDSRLYNICYDQPITSGPNRCISSYFSHDYPDSCADSTYRYDCEDTGRAGHHGTDFAAPHNTWVYAAADGVVNYIYSKCADHACNTGNDSCESTAGNYIKIDHADPGNGLVYMRTVYMHLTDDIIATHNVNVGQHIGFVGDTGRSSGCHTHFEVRYKDPDTEDNHTKVDPFYGGCNWITESLWQNQAGLPPDCP
jgi:hypothetical protein